MILLALLLAGVGCFVGENENERWIVPEDEYIRRFMKLWYTHSYLMQTDARRRDRGFRLTAGIITVMKHDATTCATDIALSP